MQNTQEKVRGKTFGQWKAEVNAEVSRTVGLHADDLADISYLELWEDGVGPKAAARKAIKASGGEGFGF